MSGLGSSCVKPAIGATPLHQPRVKPVVATSVFTARRQRTGRCSIVLQPVWRTKRQAGKLRPDAARTTQAVVAATSQISFQELTKLLFAGCSVYGALVFVLLLLPQGRVLRRRVGDDFLLLPLAVAYGYLLLHSWQPDTLSLIMPGSWTDGLKGGFNPQFFPSIAGISTLFSRSTTAVSLWVHLLVINLFAAKTVLSNGAKAMTPTLHSMLLCFMCGPVGLVSHALTERIWRWARR